MLKIRSAPALSTAYQLAYVIWVGTAVISDRRASVHDRGFIFLSPNFLVSYFLLDFQGAFAPGSWSGIQAPE